MPIKAAPPTLTVRAPRRCVNLKPSIFPNRKALINVFNL